MISPWHPHDIPVTTHKKSLANSSLLHHFRPPKKTRRTSPAGSATMPGNDPCWFRRGCSLTERRRAGRNATLREKTTGSWTWGVADGKSHGKNMENHRLGPQSIAFSCQKKWPNSIVYGRYNELVFMGIISWFINQRSHHWAPSCRNMMVRRRRTTFNTGISGKHSMLMHKISTRPGKHT